MLQTHVIGDHKPAPPAGSRLNVHFAGDTRISDTGAMLVLEGVNVAAYEAVREALACYAVGSASCQVRGDFCSWQMIVVYDDTNHDEILQTIQEAASPFRRSI